MLSWLADRSYLEIVAVCLGLCVAMTLLGLGVGEWAERVALRLGRRIYDVPKKRGQLRHEALGTALFHVVFVPVLAAVIWLGWLRPTPGLLAQAIGFAVPWYAFQAYYYGMHRALHSRALFWIHRWHHESMVVGPMTGLSMSPLEAVGWLVGLLVPPVLLARVGLLGEWGFITFLGIQWVGNIAGHVNAEIFPLKTTQASSWMSPPISYHCLHHARFDGHYGFAATWTDRLFGTEWKDWLAVHERAWSGKPLAAIRERADAVREEA